jgi:hypothetical protein
VKCCESQETVIDLKSLFFSGQVSHRQSKAFLKAPLPCQCNFRAAWGGGGATRWWVLTQQARPQESVLVAQHNPCGVAYPLGDREGEYVNACGSTTIKHVGHVVSHDIHPVDYINFPFSLHTAVSPPDEYYLSDLLHGRNMTQCNRFQGS